MKKLLLLIVLVGGFYAHDKGILNFGGPKGAFDEEGNPKVVIITFDQCDQSTNIVTRYFDKIELGYKISLQMKTI